jgi:hypothetical protein
MTDIIERLRARGPMPTCDLQEEAAAEIEQLKVDRSTC